MSDKTQGNTKGAVAETKPEKANSLEGICGIIRPISAIDGCSEEHWREIENIIGEAVEEINFKTKLVSESDAIDMIQKNIVENIYHCPIIVCDVSGKNPNVMFELGLRLASDKPTVIIKDDETDYTFDIGIIKHLTYPRSLHYPAICNFKSTLNMTIKATLNEAEKQGENYSQFTRHFTNIYPSKISEKEVSAVDFILEKQGSIEKKLDMLLRERWGEQLQRNARVHNAYDHDYDGSASEAPPPPPVPKQPIPWRLEETLVKFLKEMEENKKS